MPNELTKAEGEDDDRPGGGEAPLRVAETFHVPVVGLGASAGGIEALAQFFDAMPADSGLAFVVVLHLDPTRESQLSSILNRHTSMPVVDIEDGMAIAANHVYVIVPNNDLTLCHDGLRLSEPAQPRGHRHPVDVLFKSLAEQRQEKVIGVVLSGTGTNGTQGLREIKAAGGLILIQDPATARFDGMPRSAIGAGLADYILAPGDMPAALSQYLTHGFVAAEESATPSPDGQTGLDQLIGLLRVRSGHEFRAYKPAMLLRRIKRRMSLKNLRQIDDYITLLRTEPAEVQALLRDLLINVTSFFRDPEGWATLEAAVIEHVVADRGTGASIRVWVPACSTGEEAYSVAMLVLEHAAAAHKLFDVKIFATDIQDDNLNVARTGLYPAASVETLPLERVRRFFEQLDGSYQVKRDLRDIVVFARHDFLRDPPFSRMDLITCRNLLIYIEPEGQRRAVGLFHFGLREGGHLFLGNAETIGQADDLFGIVSKKWRIYRRLGATRHDIVDFPTPGGPTAGGPARLANRPDDQAAASDPPRRVTELARRALLERYAPASVLIDQKGRVLYFHGETSDYLRQPAGEPTRDLLAMAREGLATRLRGALHTGISEERPTRFNALVRQHGRLNPVLVTLSRLPGSHSVSGLVLVTFEQESEPRAAKHAETMPEGAETVPEGDDPHAATAALEDELRSTRSELQNTIEQLESVNEELKASNEEATSMNEELQSSNEELETSREEMQSFNEELYTVNNQLQHKVQELEDIGNDLANLLDGTEIATIFLDMDLRIKWFSPTMRQFLNIQSSDIGRPIDHFARKFADDNLLTDAAAVLARLTRVEQEVQSDDGTWYLRRMLPYRTRDNRIAGLAIVFVDITERKRAADAINEARIYAEAIVETARLPMAVLDAALRVRSANQAFYTLFNTTPDRVEEHRFYELAMENWDVRQLRNLLEEVLPKDGQFQDVEVAFGRGDHRDRTMLLNARGLMRDGEREGLILLGIEEITGRKRASGRQEVLIGELNHRVKNVLATVQATMFQTLRQSASLDDFQVAFGGRLQALAGAHDLVVERNWTGAEIGQIATQVLTAFGSEDMTRISVEGPKVIVWPPTAVALSMIFHELATNAMKYGALSVPEGKVAITWRRDGDGDGGLLLIQWTETGGPAVKAPSRQGFGTRLIERSAAHEMGGTARLDYRAEGFRCALRLPWPPAEPEERIGVR